MSDIGKIKKADQAGSAAKSAPQAETKAAQSRLGQVAKGHGHSGEAKTREHVEIEHGKGHKDLPNFGAWGDKSNDHNQVRGVDKSNDHNQIRGVDKSNDHNQIRGVDKSNDRNEVRGVDKSNDRNEIRGVDKSNDRNEIQIEDKSNDRNQIDIEDRSNDHRTDCFPHKPDKPRWENPGFFPPGWNNDPGFTPPIKPDKPRWEDPGFAPKPENPGWNNDPGWKNDPGFVPPLKPTKPEWKDPGFAPEKPKWENPGRDGSPKDIEKFDL